MVDRLLRFPLPLSHGHSAPYPEVSAQCKKLCYRAFSITSSCLALWRQTAAKWWCPWLIRTLHCADTCFCACMNLEKRSWRSQTLRHLPAIVGSRG
eukprot:jgi/Botrbrau1/21594/Bobra.43_1s0004.1